MLVAMNGKHLLGLVGWLALSAATASVGIFVRPGAWYRTLEKPAWTPPDAAFGPVWTVLYVLMAIAAWRVWRAGGFGEAGGALTLYLVQIALNAAWSVLFFGLHRPGWAFVEIVVLAVAILATIVAFAKIDRVAAGLLVPYLAWASFAAALNGTIWRLNA
jgi:tryptophan-rich sensory protein